MNLVESILTKNPCYTAGKTITVKGLMLHSVGCSQPSAAVFIKNWNSESYSRACVHAFIDGNDGTVYQTLPWNRRGWHCGSGSNGSGNNTHIGVEMCEPGSITYTSGTNFTVSDVTDAKAVAKRTYEAAVELFAYLCNKYKLDPAADGVILSHKEGHSRGVASNHGDPEHLWKGLGLSYTMDTFRAAVKKAMTTESSGTSVSGSGASGSSTSGNSGTIISESSLPAVPFTVQVLVSDLNYRDQPSMNGTVKGQTGKGTFTITEVSGGWGKLKSGAGWIYLLNTSYCTVGSTTSNSAPSSGSSSSVPYQVKVTISDLNIRKGPGTDHAKTGKQTGKGTFTIVEESEGKGSDKGWGLLKAYQSGRDGWVSLDYCQKV